MRPVRIEMEGFSAFRSSTVVDFADTDLFAFVGPTGAGKSSVIDAMIFALYGSVPRYGSDRLVHPVVTQGKPEARVRLDFDLAGTTHTAVRVVRRTKGGGATTKEARLQRVDPGGEGTVLAADARGVTDAVVELLGLDLEQFTKCVVLPQGAFAALLHDTSAKRQDLLVKLLDLGVYEQVGAAARRRVADADQRLAVIDGQLEQLAEATPEAIDAADQRVRSAEEVLATLDRAGEEVASLDRREAEAGQELERLQARLASLRAVEVPDDVESIGSSVRTAEDALAEAEDVERRAVDRVAAADAARRDLGDATAAQRLLETHDAIAELGTRIEKGQAMVAEQERAVTACQATVDQARETRARADAALDQARLDHAAADIARHLHEGDDCPVCGSTVATLPDPDDAALARAEKTRDDAVAAESRATAELADAERSLARSRDHLEELAAQLERHQAAVADAPGPEVLRERLAAIAAADEELEAARKADADARTATTRARQARDAAVAAAQRARGEYATAREQVAVLEPPAPTEDLVDDWRTLAAWAADQRTTIEEARTQHETELAEVRAARRRRLDELARAVRDAGVEVPRAATDLRPLRDACVRAATDAMARRDRLRDDLEAADRRRDERATVADQRAVHETLVGELHPKRFEAWLLEEALASLVGGASERLEQLSSGRYAMSIDDKQAFEVIDHTNADERRLARTLSGGETFLASLALALALAERVAELSPSSHTSLDAIFLDEGFGTLDPETLDVVASAIEELGASGRMVGLVSHVRELAERVPTRFEVRRGPDTSTVERVDT